MFFLFCFADDDIFIFWGHDFKYMHFMILLHINVYKLSSVLREVE